MEIFNIIEETFLIEAALTKGSQRVMADKKLVAGLADALRDDAESHPQNFPANSARNFQKAPDEELAQWFLERMDEIEKAGYEGTIYSRDGVYSDWIVRRYIAGSHNYEDLIGVMNMNLRDWTLLKNRNMLDPAHTDIPKFNSVRSLGKYLSTHYYNKLEDIRKAAQSAQANKIAKRAKIVDNDDYSLYTVFNWAGARALGLGTQWCTANSASDYNYNNYSDRAMLFQLFPKNPDQVDKVGKMVGKRTTGPEKYQFDGGSYSFHDIADDPEEPSKITKKFPYLYDDLIKGLTQNKEKLETAMNQMSEDPALNTKEGKTKKYKIDDEIKKLDNLKRMGYFTDKKRPPPKSAEEPGALPAPEGNQQMENIRQLALEMLEVKFDDVDDFGLQTEAGITENKGPIMENIDKDVKAMLDNLKKYDILKESVSPVLGMVTLNQRPVEEKKEWTPPWLKDKDKPNDEKEEDTNKDDKEEVDEARGSWDLAKATKEEEELDERDEGKHNNGKTTGFKAVAKKAAAEYGSKEAGERVAGAVRNKMKAAGKLEEEVDTGPDPEVIAWMKRFDKLGRMS